MNRLFHITILLCAAITNIYGQNPYIFTHIDTRTTQINSIVKDKNDMVWFGTSAGLMRWDDLEQESLFARTRNKALTSSIRELQIDAENRLWLKTEAGQYLIYDQENNIIITDVAQVLRELGMESVATFNIYTDTFGTILVYQDAKCYYYDFNRRKLFNIPLSVTDYIHALFVRNDICYIVGTNTIELIDVHTCKHIENISLPQIFTYSSRLVVDTKGNIWYGNRNLYRYDSREKSWRNLWTQEPADIALNTIVSDAKGNVIIGTDHHGLYIYGWDGNLKNILTHNPFDITTIADNNLQTIYSDNENNLWTGYTKHGLSVSSLSAQGYYMRHLKSVFRQGYKDDINAICPDRKGCIWFGTNGEGIVCLNPQTGEETVYTSQNGIGTDAVITFYCDSKDRMWIASYKSQLRCYENNRYIQYPVNETPWTIAEDAGKNIWVGLLGGGLYRIDNRTKEFLKVEIGSEWILDTYCNLSGKLYVATTENLTILDTQTLETEKLRSNKAGTQAFSSSQIRSVYCDSRGLVWLLCAGGGKGVVNIYNPQDDSVLFLPETEDCDIKSFIEDDNKNMWMASDKGLINVFIGYDLNAHRYTFTCCRYKSADATANSNHYNYKSAAKTADGLLYFGGVNGYSVVNPRLIASADRENEPRIRFSTIEINNLPVQAGEKYNGRVILTQNIGSTSDITLNYYENNIALGFMSLNYVSPFSTNYFYQLSGKDKNWIPVHDKKIILSNLTPGNYTLVVKAANHTGAMSYDLAQLSIRIHPPLWKSAGAYILYIILILSTISGIVYYIWQRQKRTLHRRQMEMEVERQHQINEMKIRFFTNISHDFRTPLSLIITPLEDYLARKCDEETQEFLAPVYKNALRLLTLVNQVLDFRRLEVHGATLHLSYGNIILFIKDVCSSFKLFAEDTGVQFRFSTTVERLDMSFDKDKMTKIIMNLLSNAFKFTPAGGEVCVCLETNGSELTVSVSDTGIGIRDEEKPHLFERFYQSPINSVSHNGCGIGLHIVKEYVELHKGSISVGDNHPKGAVFVCTFPVNKEKPQTDTEEEQDETLTDEMQMTETKLNTLLIVEDNAEFLTFLTKSLSTEYHVLKACNGNEALKILESSPVDIIISDVMMDEMDGLELCKIVKSNINISHIPVILLTAKAMAEDELKGLEMGADDYITKPFNLSKLKLRIKKFLEDNIRYHELFKKEIEINPGEITITSIDEELIANAIRTVEENISDPDFSVQSLSDRLGMHRAHLYKKLMFITGKTPVEFIRLIRLKRAMQYLGKSQLYVSEIAYKVGFNSPKLFAKHFKEEFNMSPSEYVKSVLSDEKLVKKL